MKLARSPDDPLTKEGLGREFAREHLQARYDDKLNTPFLLNREQIAEYHFKVFDRHRIGRNNFGGTFFSGKAREVEVHGNLWAAYADVDSNFTESLWQDFMAGAGAPERYYGPGTVMAEQIGQSVGGQKFEAALLDKYKGNIPANGFMSNYDNEFGPEEFFPDAWNANYSSHQNGSFQNGVAVVKDGIAYFRVVNTMGRKSGAYGRPLKSWFGLDGMNDKPSINGTRTWTSNIDITITWARPLSELNRKVY
jgi:hypothetical protein